MFGSRNKGQGSAQQVVDAHPFTETIESLRSHELLEPAELGILEEHLKLHGDSTREVAEKMNEVRDVVEQFMRVLPYGNDLGRYSPEDAARTKTAIEYARNWAARAAKELLELIEPSKDPFAFLQGPDRD